MRKRHRQPSVEKKKSQIIIIVIALALIILVGLWIYLRTPKAYPPLSPVSKRPPIANLEPAIFEQQDKSYADIKRFLPAGLYVEASNVMSASWATNAKTGEKQYTVTFLSSKNPDEIIKLYQDFSQNNGFVSVESGTTPNLSLKFFVARNQAGSRDLNVTVSRPPGAGTSVVLVYSVK